MRNLHIRQKFACVLLVGYFSSRKVTMFLALRHVFDEVLWAADQVEVEGIIREKHNCKTQVSLIFVDSIFQSLSSMVSLVDYLYASGYGNKLVVTTGGFNRDENLIDTRDKVACESFFLKRMDSSLLDKYNSNMWLHNIYDSNEIMNKLRIVSLQH